MQINRFTLTLIGVISFTIAAAAMIPARIAYRLFSPENAKIQLSQIKGTIWSGQANQLLALNHSFTNFEWRLSPANLLLGTLSLDLKINDPGYPFKAVITRDFDGTLHASNIKGNLPASLLQETPYTSFLGLSGTLNMDIPMLVASDQGLKSAEGSILLMNGQLTSPIQGRLGNLRFQLSDTADGVLVNINDQRAPIGVKGTLRLKPQNKFSFRASFTPRPHADAFLVTMLKNAGQQQNDGSLLIQYNGAY